MRRSIGRFMAAAAAVFLLSSQVYLRAQAPVEGGPLGGSDFEEQMSAPAGSSNAAAPSTESDGVAAPQEGEKSAGPESETPPTPEEAAPRAKSAPSVKQIKRRRRPAKKPAKKVKKPESKPEPRSAVPATPVAPANP